MQASLQRFRKQKIQCRWHWISFVGVDRLAQQHFALQNQMSGGHLVELHRGSGLRPSVSVFCVELFTGNYRWILLRCKRSLVGEDAKGNPNVALRHSRFFVSNHLCKQACNVSENKKSNADGIGFPLSGWQDSNLRPPAPKAGAITGLRYTP